MAEHPCRRCGACCAHYRVSFHWREGVDGGGGVPLALVHDLNSTLRCMHGTQARPPRCHALLGTVGERVACGIYGQRPGPCREFAPSWEDGRPNERCAEARRAHGLPPLTPADWLPKPSTPPARNPRAA